MIQHLGYVDEDDLILEPSAGDGDIVDVLLEKCPQADVHCFELNEAKRMRLKSKGYNVVGADFLTHRPYAMYEKIIAAPPFKNYTDLIHIKHMLNYLNPGGVLVSLTNPRWLTDNSPRAREFRSLIQHKDHSIYMVPEKTFMEKGKTVHTCVLVINQKTERRTSR